MKQLEVEIDVVRSTLEHVLLDALKVVRGHDRQRLTSQVDGALQALDAIDGARDPTLAWARAEDSVRNVASMLRRSRYRVQHLAVRVDGVGDGMRDGRNELLEAGQLLTHRGEEAAPPFFASHGVPRAHVLPAARGPRVQAPITPPVALGDVSGLIARLSRSLFAMAGRVARDGEAAFADLDAVFQGIGPEVVDPPTTFELVSLRMPPVTEDTVGERGHAAMLQRVGRDIFEEIGAAGLLRMPRANEPVSTHVRRFDDRVLAGLDALAALASEGRITIDVASHVTAWAADAAVSDGFRPFVRALVLSSLHTRGGADAAVLALRASLESTWPTQIHGLVLGAGERIDSSLVRAMGDADVALLPHLIDTLAARRSLELTHVIGFLAHDDLRVRAAAARGLGETNCEQARRALIDMLSREVDDEVMVSILEGLGLVDLERSRAELRQRLDDEQRDPGALSHHTRCRLVELLAIIGDGQDVQRLVRAIEQHPRDASAVGWHGSVALVEPLLACLDRDDARISDGAARSLHRITGAQLAAPDDPEQLRNPDPYRAVTSAAVWRDHWTRNGPTFEPRTRYRFGRPFNFNAVINEIVALELTWSALDLALYELRVGTGKVLPDHQTWIAAIVAAVVELRKEVGSAPSGTWLTPPSLSAAR